MGKHYIEGTTLINKIKDLVEDYMQSSFACGKYGEGLRTAEIFRECGLDWGEQENATSSNQQYWLVALLRQLEKEKKIVRNPVTKRWKNI